MNFTRIIGLLTLAAALGSSGCGGGGAPTTATATSGSATCTGTATLTTTITPVSDGTHLNKTGNAELLSGSAGGVPGLASLL